MPLTTNSVVTLATGPQSFFAYWNYLLSGMRAQALYTAGANGAQIQKCGVTCTSTLAVNYFPYIAKVLSGPSIATGALVNGSPVTITRASGSFVTDLWAVGMLCWIQNPTTPGNSLIDWVTAVSALTLTLAQNTILTAENFAGSTMQLCQVIPYGAQLGVVGSATTPDKQNLISPVVMPGLLSGANSMFELAAGEIFGLKPSRTGQAITDVTTPFGATGANWAAARGEGRNY